MTTFAKNETLGQIYLVFLLSDIYIRCYLLLKHLPSTLSYSHASLSLMHSFLFRPAQVSISDLPGAVVEVPTSTVHRNWDTKCH